VSVLMKRGYRNRFAASLVVALVLAMPAAAQEGNDMASRMIVELQQMREEVRELRGLVEAQGQELDNLRRRQRDQYLDLDARIGAASSTAAAAATPRPVDATPASPVVRVPAPVQAELPPPVAIEAPEVRAPIERAPEIVTLADPGDSGVRPLREPSEAERQAYDQAFQALRETRYADAAEGFDRFLRDYPDSSYAPNALYWLGEAYYVTRDFETALVQFQRLLLSYPGSSKQADALLKTGFSHYELGRWERARAALEQVVADHPGSNYSRLAENRLRTMRLEGHL